MFLLFAIAAVLLTLYLVGSALKPLVERGVVTAEDWDRVEDESSQLLSRRDRLVDELRDLEFEAALDKVGDRDLKALRTRFESEAVDVVRALDERASGYQARIDADLASHHPPRAPATTEPGISLDKAAPQALEPPPPATPELLEPVMPSTAPAAVHCARCNAIQRAGARFCDTCGASIDAPPASETV